jgi:hypothetical protein
MENQTNITAQELINKAKSTINRVDDALRINGFDYILTEWLTPKEYVKAHNLASISVVSNWMKRGVIPSEDIVESKSLNGLKLIRNKSYKEK